MREAKNVEWKSGFQFVWNLLRCSEPNAFGNCGAFGLSEAVRKYEKRWVTLRASGLGRRKVSRAKRKIVHHSVKSLNPTYKKLQPKITHHLQLD